MKHERDDKDREIARLEHELRRAREALRIADEMANSITNIMQAAR